MSDVVSPLARPVRRQRSIYQVHYAIPRRTDHMAQPWPPRGKTVTTYGAQVAGHSGEKDRRYLGLLQCNDGTILKPILKEAQKREVSFYTRIATTQDADLLELRRLVPKYFGCRQYTYNGYGNEYIVLEDLTERMLEPCIMDVKIGKRTWDPLASEAKIRAEQAKYQACRQQHCFCIPGLQVYRLDSGHLCKYGKEHGKKLRGDMVKEAIKTFLNATEPGGVCRALLLQFLAELWRIQRWSARPRRLRIYSASLLLAYDARRLRDCCGQDARELGVGPTKCVPAANTVRRAACGTRTATAPTCGSPAASFSGQIGDNGPLFNKVQPVPLTPITLAQQSFSPPPTVTQSAWGDALDRLTTNHAFDNNYEHKLSKIKMDYQALLDQLANDDVTQSIWGTVKIIDFAHAFFNDEEETETVDENFRDGIDNFVSILEELLKETDGQVF